MSLHKAIKHGKENRKAFFGSKAIDATCRCHGSCPHCANKRKHKILKNTPMEWTEEEEEFTEIMAPFMRKEE